MSLFSNKQGVDTRTLSNQIGNRSSLPSWLQQSLYDVAKQHDDYLRYIGVNVRTPPYNATASGVDESTIIQNALDAVPEGGVIIIPNGEIYAPNITLNKKNVLITGGGTLKSSLFVGAKTGGQNELRSTIRNITFKMDTLQTGSVGIELGKVRIFNIINCQFINLDKAIYVAPDQNYGFHDVSQIKMFENQFKDVNYNVYLDLYNDFATNTDRWMTCSDWQYIDNISNLSFISGIYLSAIDGINISGNTFFFSGSASIRGTKKQGIYIGQSDWVNIVNNHIFETGWEGIYLNNPKRFTIAHNEMAWCGDLEPRSTILITGSSKMSGDISSNLISNFTRHGVEVGGTGTGIISVKNNPMDYDSASGVYYGGIPLSSITHYSVFDNTVNMQVEETGNRVNATENITSNIKERKGSAIKTTKRTQLGGAYITKTFSSLTTAVDLVELKSTTNSSSTYEGKLIVIARNGDLDSSSNAIYELLVCKTSSSIGACVEGTKAGLTTGASGSQPSFTFTLDPATNMLRATNVGSTTGTFHFYINFFGNVDTMATAVLSDNFDRTDDATTMSNGWLHSSSEGSDTTVWGISGNRAYAASVPSSVDSVAYKDTSTSDNISIQVDVPVVTNASSRLVWRMQDKDNYYAIQNSSVSPNYLQVYKRKANAWVQIGTTVTGAKINTGNTVKVELIGSNHMIYINGVLVYSFNDPEFQTATKHGIGVGSADTTSRFDNFKVLKL